MNKLIPSLAVLLSSLAGSAPASADDPQGVLVMMPADRVFVPNGFDDNDEVQVVLDGYLPDTCHRLAFTQTTVDRAARTVHATQWARRYPGICLQIVLPFTTEAAFGQLPAGEYAVEAYGVLTEPLTIGFGVRPGPDDYLYAPVESARVEREPGGGLVGILDGRFMNTCMKLKETKVVNSGATIEVLPIAELVDRDDCTAAEIPFSWRVELPAGLSEGRHLMHVRSLNGKAVNVVFAVQAF